MMLYVWFFVRLAACVSCGLMFFLYAFGSLNCVSELVMGRTKKMSHLFCQMIAMVFFLCLTITLVEWCLKNPLGIFG